MPASYHTPLNVLQIVAQAQWGGGEQLVLDLSDGLVEYGHNIFIISKKSKEIKGKFAHFKHLDFLPIRNLFDVYSAIKLSRIIKQNSIDVIHTHSIQHAFIAVYAKLLSRRKVKIILSRHLAKRSKKLWLYYWFYHQLDEIIFVSEFAKNIFLSSAPRINKNKIKVIHNSIQAQQFDSKVGPSPLPQNKEELTIGFLGNVSQGKGIEVLIKAIELLHRQNIPVKLCIAGHIEPKYKLILECLIHEKGLENNISYIGFTNNVPAFIQSIDIGVAPSIYRESFGLTLLEYMLMGKPVIASNHGAQPEIITPGYNGFLVPPGNAQAIADTILNILNNPDNTRQIQENGIKTVHENFEYPKFIAQYIHLYHSLFKKHIVIDLLRLHNLNTGLGQVCLAYAEELAHLQHPSIRFSFLVPRDFKGYFGNSVDYISPSFRRRFFSKQSNPNIDLWHATHQDVSFFPPKKTPLVLTVHDLNFIYEKSAVKVRLRSMALARLLHRSAQTVAISKYTQWDVERHFPLQHPIKVIYNGVNISDEVIPSKPDFIHNENFFLSIGVFKPNKNFTTLIHLMECYPDKMLVIAGDHSTIHGQSLLRQIKHLHLQHRIITPGIINESEKRWLYQHCEALLFPSTNEGMGLPIIEAMRFGKPVFASTYSCLPEFGGSFAYYFQSFAPEDMKQTIEEGLADFHRHPERIEEMKTYSYSFSWKKNMQQYVALFEDLLDLHQS